MCAACAVALAVPCVRRIVHYAQFPPQVPRLVDGHVVVVHTSRIPLLRRFLRVPGAHLIVCVLYSPSHTLSVSRAGEAMQSSASVAFIRLALRCIERCSAMHRAMHTWGGSHGPSSCRTPNYKAIQGLPSPALTVGAELGPISAVVRDRPDGVPLSMHLVWVVAGL